MNEKTIQILGVALTVFYGFFVAWIYVAAPRSLEEVPIKAQETIENATTTAQIVTNTYEIDQFQFSVGTAAFREDNFIAARDAFEKADPQRRDARTQFYIASSFYRQGFGKISNDDALFRQGLERLDRIAQIDKNFRVEDADLKLKTPAELRNELEEGLKVTADDFNPLKIFRERK
jgi:hypothetical protein